jgi:predicted N-acetyltransferase YhbS
MLSSTSCDLPCTVAPGLILRHASCHEDLRAVVDCHQANFGANEDLGIMFHLADRPGQRPENVLLVQDTATGQAVSSVSLTEETWRYEGIDLHISEVGVVSTRHEYRQKGLVRAQFDRYHRMAAERGCLISIIAGIPYFYRQFGYDYILAAGGGRHLRPEQVPDLATGDSSPYRLRPAEPQEIPLMQRFYAAMVKGLCVTAVVTDDIWRYQDWQPPTSSEYKLPYLVEREGVPVGYVRMTGNELDTWNKGAKIVEASLPDREACLAALRLAKRVALEERTDKLIKVDVPADTLLSQVAAELGGEWQRPYAWQVRVLDHAAFLKTIGPALERRLAASSQAGLTKDFSMNLYTQVFVLHFQGGKLVEVSSWPPGTGWDIAAPPTIAPMFWLGYRSFDEVLLWYPDVMRKDEPARQLADILFPKRASWVRSLF